MRHLQRLGVRSRRANDMRGSLYRRARSHCACRARDDTEGSQVGVPTIPGGRHVVPITRESREAVCRGVRRKVRDILEVPDVGVVVEVEVPDDVPSSTPELSVQLSSIVPFPSWPTPLAPNHRASPMHGGLLEACSAEEVRRTRLARLLRRMLRLTSYADRHATARRGPVTKLCEEVVAPTIRDTINGQGACM